MLMTIEQRAEKFPWGSVTQIHIFNDIVIYEYVDKLHGNTQYSPYQIIKTPDGKESIRDFMHSYRNIDEAMVNAIAFKYDGINSQGGIFMTRMVGIGEE